MSQTPARTIASRNAWLLHAWKHPWAASGLVFGILAVVMMFMDTALG